jgi:UDP-N-acetylmuramoyl-L-alanyl-D-glutamate--2,6-diaminopimelate ligase
MGKIAGDYANTVIVTDDNPRTEDPSSIRDEIISGFRGAINIGDRSEAISFAMSKLKSDDVLIVAGKGIENYQIIGAEKKYFSDIEQIKKNFK